MRTRERACRQYELVDKELTLVSSRTAEVGASEVTLELIGGCAPLAEVTNIANGCGRQLVRRHQVWWTAGLEAFWNPGGGACREVVVLEEEKGESAENEGEKNSGLRAGAARQALREGHSFGPADDHAWAAGSGSVGGLEKVWVLINRWESRKAQVEARKWSCAMSRV